MSCYFDSFCSLHEACNVGPDGLGGVRYIIFFFGSEYPKHMDLLSYVT